MPPRRYSNEERQEAVGLILDAGWTAKATAEHLGMNARSVATWANAERAARRGREWTEQVKPHFGFLEAYGFAVAMASAADWWEVTVTYQSSISAVTIVQSVECDQVIVLLTRPTDGNLPKDAWQHSYFAGRLVQFRAGHKAAPRKVDRDRR